MTKSESTPRLWDYDHPYYCEESNYFAPGREQPFDNYFSWNEFILSENDESAPPDLNLLFRWDWVIETEEDGDDYGYSDGEPRNVLKLFYMSQRKGIYRWAYVYLTPEDEPAAKEWLRTRWLYLKKLWEPISDG